VVEPVGDSLVGPTASTLALNPRSDLGPGRRPSRRLAPCLLRCQGILGSLADQPALELHERRHHRRHRLTGEASGLVAATLDRLTRSLSDFAELMTWFREADAQLAVLDTNLDTTTPTGEAMAAMMATFVQLERRLIGQRTKDALAAKKVRGELPGRPAIGPKVRSRIERQRRRGWTYQRIADKLNADEIPTARGGAEWRPSSVATGLGYRQKPRRHRAELPTLGRRS